MQLIDVERQLEDVKAAVSYARTLPAVDVGRIAWWGTSLGAGHVVRVAAMDAAIAAGVAQLPFMGVDPRNLRGVVLGGQDEQRDLHAPSDFDWPM